MDSLLAKAAETVRVFLNSRPSLRGLWASRNPSFDRAHAILPSNAVVGEPVSLTTQVWDEYERLYPEFDGEFAVDSTDPDATHPAGIDFGSISDGVRSDDGITFETPGIQYLTLSRGGERFVSNPVDVTAAEPDRRTYWGDIHLHSRLSDGAGSIGKGMRFGRDVMDLDVVAYTDHDTMGFFIPPQLQRRRMHRRYFEEMKAATHEYHDPGEFVTLFGYEWTKQPNKGGHINVYFDAAVDEAELFDSLDPATNTYEKLWRRLDQWRERTGNDALTIPHHTAEKMYPFDFSAMDYDDDLAPLVEVYSQWGSSEMPGAAGNPAPLEMGQGEVETPGHYVQDALAMGHRVGMIAGADYHGPFPGHSLIHADPHFPALSEWREDGVGWGHIWRLWSEGSYPGGLTAFRAPELTREAVFDSLRSRRVYGTTQPDRILVDFEIDGVAVGEHDSEVTVPSAESSRTVSWRVAGTAPLSSVTVVRNNEPWTVVEGTDDADADLATYTAEGSRTDDDPITGMGFEEQGTDADCYYLRVRQADGGMAWAGPLWVAED
ncbi:DUF3604 domain-containing protein [Halorientalis marina]|uniref:DUF3604 domain-containing protein n=1 Tax=Halorientalis marina TaxID=2931976 RepID=UPI001FF23337|nr:DUF3604 domain-containing protein [Halorientalis marina]